MDKRRILILSANTGEGHNSAAKALREAFESHGHVCTIQDGLAFLPSWVNAVICRGHIFLYCRLPRLFGLLYSLCEQFSRHKTKHHRSKYLSKSCRKLLEYIVEGRFDAVICTHVFPAGMISRLRRNGKLVIPCYFLATDYSCSPGVNRLDMDGWFIPHQKLTAEFSNLGIAERLIFPTGLPVRREFEPCCDRAALRRKLGLPESRPVAVLSCGSMGADGMARVVRALEKNLADNALAVVICSRNTRLEQHLKTHICSRSILILGFVDRLSDYMEAADIYLTKPGGLSTTEAISKRTPLVLFDAVPGVESRNMAFLTGIGCAAAAKNTDDLLALVNRLLEDTDARSQIADNCRYILPGNAAENICNIILNEKELSL